MSNLNLSQETSWNYLGAVTIQNPNYRYMPRSELPVLGSRNAYRITAITNDEMAINRSYVMAGWANLSVYGASLAGGVHIKSQRMLLNRANILYTPFRANEYLLEFSIASWLSNITYQVDETTVFLDLDNTENLILNELNTGFVLINSKLDQLLNNQN